MTGNPGFRLLAGVIGLALIVPALTVPSLAQPAPPSPAAAQPSLPKPLDGAVPLNSQLIGGGSGSKPSSRKVERHFAPARSVARRRGASRRYGDAEPLERPALAGVELVAPIPKPVQPPHFTVPVPAYLPENAATFYTTPPPPVICHRVPRDPYAPDPHLVRETTVLCEADNP